MYKQWSENKICAVDGNNVDTSQMSNKHFISSAERNLSCFRKQQHCNPFEVSKCQNFIIEL